MTTVAQFCQRQRISIKTAEERGVTWDDDDWQHQAWLITLVRSPREDPDVTMQVKWRQGMAHSGAPSVEDVFYAVTSDAGSFENARDAADFCAEFGYEDTGKGRDVYLACADQAKKLKRFLNGNEALYQRAVYDLEPL